MDRDDIVGATFLMFLTTVIIFMAWGILSGCASAPPKPGCVITKKTCPAYAIDSSPCTLTFDDGSLFYLPYELAKELHPGESICQ